MFLIITLLLLPFFLLLLFLYFTVGPKPVTIPIKNRHVFITGGSSGIGLALAQRAVSEGARVSLLARSLHKLEEAQKSIRLAYGIDVAIFSADVRDYDAVEKAVKDSGPIDVLVVNQGVLFPKALEKHGLDEIKCTIDVNLMGSINVIKAALPLMKKNKKDGAPASIALMSSMAGQAGVYGYSVYSATKFAIRGLAESLQQELISDNIRVTIIFPPDTETPGLEEERKTRAEVTSIIVGSGGRVWKAEEVAKKSLDGIKRGCFSIWFSLEGYIYGFCTAGSSPQTSFFVAFLEVVFAGLSRLVALINLWIWYRIIKKLHTN